MFGFPRRKQKRWIALAAGSLAVGVAAAIVVPAVRKRALRATTVLKKDHRVVSGLFWSMRQTTNTAARRAIFQQLQNALEIHGTVEDEIFYPTVRQVYTTVAEQLVDAAHEAHQKIKDLYGQAAVMNPDSWEFMSKVNELHEVVKNHVEREENEMFPLVEQNLPADELEDLGRRIRERKAELKNRLAA